MPKTQTRLLIAYSFAGEESEIEAPNFYKSCAEKVFPSFSVDASFLPDVRRERLCIFLTAFGLNQSLAVLACSAVWLVRHGGNFDVIVGWLGNGVMAAA